MPEPPVVRVSLVYAEPERVFSVTLELPDGATVADAIDRSGIQTARPDIDIRADRVGIFSRKATRASRLRDGDRVEIYRPLKIDPKEARRRRAGKT
ncbi:MAG TPA: RnfH family protein [Rhodanobacteraceae bacterium]|jgi:putative ubiquitin-RnfH superfamily antitoxin RatB of RatAB toxin-antitoxin module|nr:RnfH family protein [Rhodanobacteraceae bacterium]HEU4857421.1 RnfH family protein [Rhodanobacteraceae bacterium]